MTPLSAKKETAEDILKNIRETLQQMALEQIRYHDWEYSGRKVVTDRNARPSKHGS